MKKLVTVLLILSLQTSFAEVKEECSEKNIKFLSGVWMECKAECYKYEDQLKLDKCLVYCLHGIDELKKAVCHPI